MDYWGWIGLAMVVALNWWACFALGRRLGRREGWMAGAKLMGPRT